MAGTVTDAQAGASPASEAAAVDRNTVDLKSLWRAWQACRLRKRGTRECIAYSGRLLDQLAAVQAALIERRWRPSRTRVFVTTRPKAREIHAPTFADRVVHHWLVPQLEALFEPVFIHDSYANRAGKGTHAAVQRLQTFMRQATRNGKVRAYAMQFDIANCFNCVNRRLLYQLVEARIARACRNDAAATPRWQLLAWLARRLLTGNPGLHARRVGDRSLFDRVPPHKRLANAAPECGMPIGNLSSQFFVNVYLNELDQFIKHTLKCRWYVRYVDDFVMLASSEAQLIEWRGAVQQFLRERLQMELRLPEPAPMLVSRGVDFLGYIVRPAYLLVRQRVMKSALRALQNWERVLVSPKGVQLTSARRTGLCSTVASYAGHFGHANCAAVMARLWLRFPWLQILYVGPPAALTSALQAPQSSSLAGQHSWFAAQHPQAVVWMQVGCCWECYDKDALLMMDKYGLAAAKTTRAMFSTTVAVPMTAWKRWQHIFTRDGVAAIGAEQAGRVPRHRAGLRQRALSYVSPAALRHQLPSRQFRTTHRPETVGGSHVYGIDAMRSPIHALFSGVA